MADPLQPSDEDAIKLCEAVRVRFLDLADAHQRIRGVRLSVPKDVEQDGARWRTMWHRHAKGDFRHTEAEYLAMKAFAAWTLQVNSAMRNQGPVHIEWKEDLGIV